MSTAGYETRQDQNEISLQENQKQKARPGKNKRIGDDTVLPDPVCEPPTKKPRQNSS